MPTLLRDLIDLPEQVRQGDFVLRLSEGVTKPAETLKDYVVTEQLAKCFDEALGLIQSAVQSKTSKGAYLHGSFGSGKSHFMAVLLLLLEGNPQARSIPELAGAVAKLNGWAGSKKFLLVPYHMIGAKDLTSAVLGGYVDHVLKHHPGAPTPGVFRSEALFANAQELRNAMGDPVFFAKLNTAGSTAKPASDGWGKLGGTWDGATFAAAIAAGPKDERKARLVGDIVANVLPAMHGTSEFVDIDHGLAIISRHAKELGYDGLILFLDELILWLASHAADVNFIAQEGQKLAKLVEAQDADRPTPIVSFIARQRDLRELVGDNMLGVQQVSFSDSLKHWDQRFGLIRLDDRNLPLIAQKRVLKPKSETAKQQIDQSFRDTEKIRQEVLNILLTSQGTKVDFRAVYPFSPALMETLVALSSLLQRERTALKIMFQLLVEQRDSLQLGEIVPVGDLFDAIMKGEEPFSDAMKAHAENARKLYLKNLLPLIEAQHGITREEVTKLPRTDARASAFRRDDRLAKTLLLSALAPEVESFKGMTVNKLAALNHGSIRTPVPGREGQIVLESVRKWAAEIGQIRIGDEQTNPSVTVQLSGVDTEGILAQAASEDNPGNRVRKLKQLVFDRLGIAAPDDLVIQHAFEWRATKRTCEVLFTNVRELNDESFRNTGDCWKLIIDYPFDPDSTHTPRSDVARLERFKTANPGGSRVLVWLPSFFNQQAQKDLGRLVVLEHVLVGARFDGYAARLSAVDRAQARTLLDNQRSTLKVRIEEYLDVAYGIRPDSGGVIDTTHQLDPEEQVQSLHPEAPVRSPAAANLGQALNGILDQALQAQFPAHPAFEPETKLGKATLTRVWSELQRALGTPEHRVMVDPGLRREIRPVVTALQLASMVEAHLVTDDEHWRLHFERKQAQSGGNSPSVATMRQWLNEPKAMGLPAEVENLILLFIAERTGRVWILHGNPYTATIDEILNDAELREQILPSEAEWKTASDRATGIFGLSPSPLRSAANVAKLTAELKTQVDSFIEPVRELAKELRTRLAALGVPQDTSARWATANSALRLLEALRTAPERERVAALIAADLPSTEVAVGTAIKQAATVTRSLREMQWMLIESAARLADHRQSLGQALWKRTQQLLQNDELAQALPKALREIADEAAKLLAAAVVPSAPPIPTAPAPSIPSSIPSNAAPVSAVATGPVTGPSKVAVPATGWGSSDEAEVRAFYANDPEKIARNRRLVAELKALYKRSQAQGDSGPTSLAAEHFASVLEVHHIVPLHKGGADERSNMIVLSPTLHALVHADPNCVIDLQKGLLRVFGCEVKLAVDPRHNG